MTDGTAYDFNTPEAKAAAMYINDLRDAGCTFETESYPNPEQANRLALVTLSSTTGLKYYGYAFADGAFQMMNGVSCPFSARMAVRVPMPIPRPWVS